MRNSTVILLSISLAAGCSIKSSLLGKSGPSVSDTSASADDDEPSSQKTSASQAEEDEPLTDRAKAALALVPEVEKQCPKTEAPPPSEEACEAAIAAFTDKYQRIGVGIQRADVKEARRTVDAAREQQRSWNGYRSDRSSEAYAAQRDYEDDARSFESAFEALGQGRKNKAGFVFTSDISEEAEYLKESLDRLGVAKLGDFASKHCKKGAAKGDSANWHKDRAEKCELAVNRVKYYRQWVEAGVLAAVMKDTGNWENAVESLEREGVIYTVNYDLLTARGKLNEHASKRVKAIVKATGIDFDAAKAIRNKLEPVQKELKTALAKWSKDSQWKLQAGRASRSDSGGKAAVKRNLGDRGEKLIRFGVYNAEWDVKMELSRPVERTKDTAVLAKAKGESFCRIYHLRIVQEHQGGGRYTKTKVYTVGFERFYVSACK